MDPERETFWRMYATAVEAVAADPTCAAEERAELDLWDRTTQDGLSPSA